MTLLLLLTPSAPTLPRGTRATVALRDRPTAAVSVRAGPKATVQVTPAL